MNVNVKVSKRLQVISSFIPSHAFFADIGSDHAYLPCFVCQQDDTVNAIAGEVKKGPFLRAEKTVRQFNLCNRIDVRLGNGLQVVQPEDHITDVVIAGMGGSLIGSILKDGKDKLFSTHRIIVQPNTNASVVRKIFFSLDYTLVNEVILEENNRIYEVLVAEKDSSMVLYDSTMDMEKQLMFGPLLMREKDSSFIRKWLAERDKLIHVMNQMDQGTHKEESKIQLFKKRLQWIEEVL